MRHRPALLAARQPVDNLVGPAADAHELVHCVHRNAAGVQTSMIVDNCGCIHVTARTSWIRLRWTVQGLMFQQTTLCEVGNVFVNCYRLQSPDHVLQATRGKVSAMFSQLFICDVTGHHPFSDGHRQPQCMMCLGWVYRCI